MTIFLISAAVTFLFAVRLSQAAPRNTRGKRLRKLMAFHGTVKRMS